LDKGADCKSASSGFDSHLHLRGNIHTMRQSKFHRDIPNDMKITPPTQDEVNKFLDGLRESGDTNMFGAVPYLQKRFGFTRYEAYPHLIKWMETFGERYPQDD
jgi:hypothetical protein